MIDEGRRFQTGEKIGKYRLVKKMGDGGFAVVFKAYDSVEGQHVALKVYNESNTHDMLRFFKKEVNLLSKINHDNILKLKNADVAKGRLYIVSELGLGNLSEKERRTIRLNFAVSALRQILEALIEVQKHNIVHRDIKPENIIIFPGGVVKLGDFGIAKVIEKVRRPVPVGTDAGTHGYFAPEQIYGKPSFSSDIFSLGLVFYEMITGVLPRWPFRWPFVGKDKFNRRVPAHLRKVIRKSLEFDEEDRYPDALSMYKDLMEALYRKSTAARADSKKRLVPWRKYREMEFRSRYDGLLKLKFRCCTCDGPISEFMMHCPWCGTDKNSFKGLTSFPAACRRCHHGVKDEWDYCPWCYGKKFSWADVWVTKDSRYIKKCPNRYCSERKIMRWMHYCPWCHVKLKPWIVPQLKDRCPKCRWSVTSEYWDHCAWCGTRLH